VQAFKSLPIVEQNAHSSPTGTIFFGLKATDISRLTALIVAEDSVSYSAASCFITKPAHDMAVSKINGGI